FQKQRGAEGAFREVCARLDDGRHPRVGLVTTPDDLEYPLWLFTGGRVRFEHVFVANCSGPDRWPPLPPTLLVFAEASPRGVAGYRVAGGRIGPMTILERD